MPSWTGRVGAPASPPGACSSVWRAQCRRWPRLEKRLDRYERAAIHHAVLSRRQVAYWCETLAAEDRGARLTRPGMVEGRADVIVGGVLILGAVMDRFGRHECLVSEEDILDGLAASLL